MNGNKKSRPGAATPGRQKGNEMNTYILHAKRAIVKGLAVLVGLWFLSALAALDLPAVLLAVLIENALLGAWFALDGKLAKEYLAIADLMEMHFEKEAEDDAAGNPQQV